MRKIYFTKILFGLAVLVCLSGQVWAQGTLPKPLDAPDEGYLSNSSTDIVYHDGAIWLATGEGLGFSYDDGLTWQSYNSQSGMISDIISAVYSDGTRLWVGTSHSELIDGIKYSMSDGVSYSDNSGFTWNQIDFNSTGQNINSVLGGFRTVFDITGHEDWVFFSAFAGGLLMSPDRGVNWRRIFPSTAHSVQFNASSTPSEQNRYFSCATDASHGDTLMLWSGTAGGIFQYIYAPKREKPFSPYIYDIVIGNDSGFIYYGGENGLTRGYATGGPFISRFGEDLFPNWGEAHLSVTSVYEYGNRLFASVASKETPDDLDALVVSDDNGQTFDQLLSFNNLFTENLPGVSGMASMGYRLYVATSYDCIIMSEDTGTTWQQVLIDSTLPLSDYWNNVNALTAYGDTLFVGTDTGMVKLYLDPVGAIDSLAKYPFADDDTSAARVMGIRIQEFWNDVDTMLVDSVVYWTFNSNLTTVGRPMVGRRNALSDSWQFLQLGVRTNDIAFFGDTAFVVGEAGARFTLSGSNPSIIYEVTDVRSGYRTDSLDLDVMTSMKVRGDTVVIGTDNGFALSTDRGANYRIYRPNIDLSVSDLVIHHHSLNALRRLIGDFIPAIGVQYIDDGPARVWASNRSTVYWPDTNAISVGKIVAVDANGDEILPGSGLDTAALEHQWAAVYTDDFAWNFTFNGDSVFVASSSGLLFTEDYENGWDTIPLVDDVGEPLVMSGTPVYAVEVVDEYLWVGTGDRTIRIQIDLSDFSNQQPYFVIDSTSSPDEVYAFPVPFSHVNDDYLDFHFVVEQDAEITLEIYDFAMSLVATVVDSKFYSKGIYPTHGSNRITWDGYNGKGEKVAVGVYYFKVELSTGDVRWGKLAVIP